MSRSAHLTKTTTVDSGDCTTVATQPEATTLLQQFIKKKFFLKGTREGVLYSNVLEVPLQFAGLPGVSPCTKKVLGNP